MTTKIRQKGRPPSDRDTLRDEVYRAATVMLVAYGFQKTTMLAIATEAGMSKNTLYSLFPSKDDLFCELVESRASAMNQHLDAALGDETLGIEQGLKQFGIDVLRILTSDVSLAINRAAINGAAAGDLGLSDAYMDFGRRPTYQRVMAMLERARDERTLAFDITDDAMQDFLGLLQGDQQLRQLLGVTPAPIPEQLEKQVDRAVTQFMKLYGC